MEFQATSTVTVVQVPASITLSGDGQSAPINTAFGTPLAATVLDAGSQPIVNQSVTYFTAPASGASDVNSQTTPIRLPSQLSPVPRDRHWLEHSQPTEQAELIASS